MDDIQFWIYVIFAIIYFIAKNFKKNNTKTPQKGKPRTDQEGEARMPQPQSFEDLLEEISGRRTVSKPPVQEEAFDDSFEDQEEARYLQPKPWESEQSIETADEFEQEGRNRKFADEESKRIYEESIKRAEGADLPYEVDEKFASKKVLRETAEEKETNKFAEEINDMLRDRNDARKAIILGEILNRKY